MFVLRAINQESDALIWDHNFICVICIFSPRKQYLLILKCYAIKEELSFPFLCILASWVLSYLCCLLSWNIHEPPLLYLMKVCIALRLTFSDECTSQKFAWQLISAVVFAYFFACFRSGRAYRKLLIISLTVSDFRFHSSPLETE